jgi:hypothetical protein
LNYLIRISREYEKTRTRRLAQVAMELLNTPQDLDEKTNGYSMQCYKRMCTCEGSTWPSIEAGIMLNSSRKIPNGMPKLTRSSTS